jgi:hypothetical protein
MSRPFTPAERRTIREMAERGHTNPEIAEAIGRTIGGVYDYRESSGIGNLTAQEIGRRRRGPAPSTVETGLKHLRGMTDAEIMEEDGLTRSQVSGRIRRYRKHIGFPQRKEWANKRLQESRRITTGEVIGNATLYPQSANA